MVNTDLPRSLKDESVFIRMGAPILMALVAQAPEVGSRTYLAAGLTAESEHVESPPPPLLLANLAGWMKAADMPGTARANLSTDMSPTTHMSSKLAQMPRMLTHTYPLFLLPKGIVDFPP
jgi:hypothetical protein